MKKFLTVLFFVSFLSIPYGFAQYPSYFNYTIESGSPSNEIYSILQDKEGYIWIGCDAGVYRFNGVSFEHFSSPDLTARSATGLFQTTNGRIYGYNFNSQIFYIEEGKLNVIKNWKFPVNGIASDQKGKIWVSSSEGAFTIDEKTLKCSSVHSKFHATIGNRIFTNNMYADAKGTIYYHNYNGIFVWKNGKERYYTIDTIYEKFPILFSRSKADPWFFDFISGNIYQKKTDGWEKYKNAQLSALVKDRKINAIVDTDDNFLWICTHSGLIRFNKKNEVPELIYSQLSFSNCLKDREGNYWFSTLHNGLIRIPEFNIRTWNIQTGAFDTDPFSHVDANSNNIYFAGTTGMIGELKRSNAQISTLRHEPKSDFGMLHYDVLDHCVYFNKMSNIYKFQNGKVDLVNNYARPIKYMLHTSDGYFLLSSQGIYFTNDIGKPLDANNRLIEKWFREICVSPFSNAMFAASNNGLYEFRKIKGKWKVNTILLKDKQIISLCADKEKKMIYFLTFEGKIYSINANGKLENILGLDKEMRASQIRLNKGSIYLATNKGILKVDPDNLEQILIDKYSGLSSNNVRSISFDLENCWVASGKGIQCIPLELFKAKNQPGHVLFRELNINGKTVPYVERLELKYNDAFSLILDGICYRSNSNFLFAYRILGYNNKWITVPGSAGKIEIPKLPSGDVTIEVKLIDHEGNNSENMLRFKLKVEPPFWQRWWFYVLITITTLSATFLIFKRREQLIKKKQAMELSHLQLQNDLRLTQQNALKAQMNPHFLFNVLNSIKGYIYENDKKNAARYLGDFSNLVRKVLELSSLPVVSLEMELEALKLYIDLEAMLLQNDFKYTIDIDDNVDSSGIKVPALLLQPYVENALKHGLRHKLGNKELKIHVVYKEEDELLVISISDNGIGREAAEKINDSKRTDHQSFATEAIKRRIELLNHDKKGVVGVEIVDNFDPQGNPDGTTVIIRIHV